MRAAPARAGPLPYALLCVSAFAWGGNVTIGRFVHEQMPPATLNLSRWVVALLVLLPFTARSLARNRHALLRHWRYMVVMAATGLVLFHTLLYRALQDTEAINTALMLTLTPALIVVLSRLLFAETVRLPQALGIVVSMGGAVVLVSRGDPDLLHALDFNGGDLWALAAVPNWALYSVLLRRRPAALDARTFLAGTVVYALLLMLPLVALEWAAGARPVVGIASVASVLYVGVVASVVAFSCWNRGVALVGANRAGQFLHLVPLAAAALSVLLLGEEPRLYHALGLGLVFTGIWVMGGAPLPGRLGRRLPA